MYICVCVFASHAYGNLLPISRDEACGLKMVPLERDMDALKTSET